jgi:hypothetical protein
LSSCVGRRIDQQSVLSLLFLLHSSIEEAGPRTLRREWHAGPCQETKKQKGRSTREGSALSLTWTTPKAMAKRHLQDII